MMSNPAEHRNHEHVCVKDDVANTFLSGLDSRVPHRDSHSSPAIKDYGIIRQQGMKEIIGNGQALNLMTKQHHSHL
jgi:hypothetical protein